jgi:hypothetical protein
MSEPLVAPDLTQRPPRSPRVRLGGFVILPRMLDKGRAMIAGQNGEYHYACPVDQRFLTSVGVDPDALKEQLAVGKGDAEILQWIHENASHDRGQWEIAQWSDYLENLPPGDIGSREFFNQLHGAANAEREDIGTWFDLLDLDDHVTFGGKA